MNQQDPGLSTLLMVLRRRVWLLLTLSLTTAVAAFFISGALLRPVYSASTTLWVIKDETEGPMQYSDLLFNQTLTKTYAEVARSRTVVGNAIAALGWKAIRIQDIQARMTVTTVRDTQLLAFAVEDHDPAAAARLADALAEAFTAEIRTHMKIENIRVVDTALVPTEPIRPRPVLNAAVWFLLALVMTAGLTALRESTDASVHTPDDAARILGLPVLGSIPLLTRSRLSHGETLVTKQDPGGPASEAFRMLRTNLLFLDLDRQSKSILITSAVPGEGKTTTAANLAVAFALTGVRVCLVEGDLRRPVLGRLLGLQDGAQREPLPGVTTALVSRSQPEVMATGITGLWALPAGPIPPNPAELLGSQRMGSLLAWLEQQFDMVLVDSPPVLAVTDAAVLAPRVGGVLLVVRAGTGKREQVVRAREALCAVKANLLGAVLSSVPEDPGPKHYYQAYYSGRRPRERRLGRG